MCKSPDAPPWLLVCGGFHRRGAMDLANLALAEHLLSEGRDVYLVGHEIDPALRSRRGVHAHRVTRLGAVAAGEFMLARSARKVEAAVRTRAPKLHVIANGGNFATADANWVHTVHHAWPDPVGVLPPGRRLKRSLEQRVFRRREARAFRMSRLLLANSDRTRQDLLDHFRLDPSCIHVLPPGTHPSWRPPSPEESRDARLQLRINEPVVLFMGALGTDDNKGFGPLLEAWRRLCADPSWRGTLAVAGTGPLLGHWKRDVRRLGLGGRVRFLGFVHDVARVLAASDVLVSASRYEAYGLAIAEALSRGVPAIVPALAGIASSLSPACEGLLLRSIPNAESLADALRRWASDQPRWRAVAAAEGGRLRRYSLDDMAAEIVSVVEA